MDKIIQDGEPEGIKQMVEMRDELNRMLGRTEKIRKNIDKSKHS